MKTKIEWHIDPFLRNKVNTGDVQIWADVVKEDAIYIVHAVDTYDALVRLADRVADFECFKPFGVLCINNVGGEEACEACTAKELLAKMEAI